MHELVVINLSDHSPQCLGKFNFKQMPQPGDWIETEDKNKHSLFYEVIQVVHSSTGAGAGLYVGNPRPGAEARCALHKSFLEKHPI